MMHGHEKSDPAIVAGKPANKAELSAAEPVEPRAGTKGNASQQSTRRTQSRENVSQALDRRVTMPRVTAFPYQSFRRSFHCGVSHYGLSDSDLNGIWNVIRQSGGNNIDSGYFTTRYRV